MVSWKLDRKKPESPTGSFQRKGVRLPQYLQTTRSELHDLAARWRCLDGMAWIMHGMEHLQDGDANISLRDHTEQYFLTFTVTFLDGLVLKHVFTCINVHIKKEKYQILNHRTEGFRRPTVELISVQLCQK